MMAWGLPTIPSRRHQRWDPRWGALRTKTQLRRLGLVPGGPARGQVFFDAHNHWVKLYNLFEARPRQAAAKAEEAARIEARAEELLAQRSAAPAQALEAPQG